MIIDLTNVPIGVAETHRDLYILKSAEMYKELNKMERKHNFIIMPISVYNVIECHQYFEPCQVDIDEGIFKVGDFCGYECYVDMMITDNRIIMSKDIQSMRDNKINAILGLDKLDKDLDIKIVI
jgi:hypothetical protein